MKAVFITLALVLFATSARVAGEESEDGEERQSLEVIRAALKALDTRMSRKQEKKPGFSEELDGVIKRAVSRLGTLRTPVQSIFELLKRVGVTVRETARDLNSFIAPRLKELLIKINKALDEELAKHNIDVPKFLRTTEKELQDMSKKIA